MFSIETNLQKSNAIAMLLTKLHGLKVIATTQAKLLLILQHFITELQMK